MFMVVGDKFENTANAGIDFTAQNNSDHHKAANEIMLRELVMIIHSADDDDDNGGDHTIGDNINRNANLPKNTNPKATYAWQIWSLLLLPFNPPNEV